MVKAAGSNRDDGMIPPGNGAFVTGSLGLMADWEKSPARSRGVGTTAVFR